MTEPEPLSRWPEAGITLYGGRWPDVPGAPRNVHHDPPPGDPPPPPLPTGPEREARASHAVEAAAAWLSDLHGRLVEAGAALRDAATLEDIRSVLGADVVAEVGRHRADLAEAAWGQSSQPIARAVGHLDAAWSVLPRVVPTTTRERATWDRRRAVHHLDDVTAEVLGAWRAIAAAASSLALEVPAVPVDERAERWWSRMADLGAEVGEVGAQVTAAAAPTRRTPAGRAHARACLARIEVCLLRLSNAAAELALAEGSPHG